MGDMIKPGKDSKKPPTKTSASNSLRNDSKSNKSIKSMIDDDDDKMSVRSGSTMRSNKSNTKDNKDTMNINDINLTTQTITNVKKEENSFAKLTARISLKSTLPVKAVQKDARILELEDLCQLLMDQLRDNEILVNNMKND